MFCAMPEGDVTVAVEEALRVAGQLETVLTERPLHAAEIAEAVSRGEAERIYVFSGDGGFNAVVNGLEADLPVGFTPGGATSGPPGPEPAASLAGRGRSARGQPGQTCGPGGI